MNGVYWGLTSLDILGQVDKLNEDEVVDFVKSCQHECG
jgi:geranylgeranyl transferase type-2 subunit beta